MADNDTRTDRDELIRRAANAGWHEFTYPRTDLDGPSERFIRAMCAAAEELAPVADDATAKLRADAVKNRDTYVEQFCTRRIDFREGDYTQEQLAEWQETATRRWVEAYPALAALTGEGTDA